MHVHTRSTPAFVYTRYDLCIHDIRPIYAIYYLYLIHDIRPTMVWTAMDQIRAASSVI